MGRQNAAALEFDPKPSEAAFSIVFRCSFRPEVGSDVISGMVDQHVGMDACANFGDYKLNLSEASFSGTTNDGRHSMFGLKLQLLIAAYYRRSDGPHLTDSL